MSTRTPPSEPQHARVLVVEDDLKTADLVALYLRHEGYRVEIEYSGDRARTRIDDHRFDLVILDVMLPGMNGLELCRHIVARHATPVILLTARSLEEHRVEGLDLGADDYISKPFSPRELVARVRAVLRRVPPGEEKELRCGEVALDLNQRTVRVAGREVELTASEFALLHALVERPGHVRTRSQLLERLPSGPLNALDRTVDVHILKLRRKLSQGGGSDHQYIETVFGVGYRFAPPGLRHHATKASRA